VDFDSVMVREVGKLRDACGSSVVHRHGTESETLVAGVEDATAELPEQIDDGGRWTVRQKRVTFAAADVTLTIDTRSTLVYEGESWDVESVQVDPDAIVVMASIRGRVNRGRVRD
jgi:hypothetical protein